MFKHTEFRYRKFVASLFLVAAVLSLYPWTGGLEGWVSNQHVEYDFPQHSVEEAKQILTAVLTDTAMAKEITPELHYRISKVMAMFSRTPDTPYQRLVEDAGVWHLNDSVGRLRVQKLNEYDPVKRGQIMGEAEGLCRADPECFALKESAKPVYDFGVIRSYVVVRYPFAMLIAMPFFLIMFRVRGIRLLSELLTPMRPITALVLFWGSWKFYPYIDTRERLTRAAHFAGLCLTFLLSTAGGAVGQTVKKAASGEKRDPEHTLQIDGRVMDFVDGPPKNIAQLRVSLYERKFMIETIAISTPGQGRWYSETGGGWFVRKTAKTWLTANVMSTQNQDNERAVTLGGQFYHFGPRFTWAFPLIRYEHQTKGPPGNTFAVTTNPLLRIKRGGRWGIAPDVSLRKTLTKPLNWAAGAGVKFFPGKGRRNSVELGVFRNWQGYTSLRARTTINFAF